MASGPTLPTMQQAIRVGLDLGGTKIEGIALSPDGSERARRRVATPRGGYAATVEAVAVLAEQLEREAGGLAPMASRTRSHPQKTCGLNRIPERNR